MANEKLLPPYNWVSLIPFENGRLASSAIERNFYQGGRAFKWVHCVD